jgi:hypothetical protein
VSTTATRKRNSPPAIPETTTPEAGTMEAPSPIDPVIRDMIERRHAQASAEFAAREALLNQVVQEYGDGPFVPAKLHLSPGVWIMLEDAGCKGGFEACRLLESHRATLRLRSEVGDPAILAAAKARLDECREVERTARAELTEIEVPDAATPALARQITNLESRLKSVVEMREAAERHVAAIEGKRSRLREKVPQFLKDSVARTVGAVQATHATWWRHEEVFSEINFIKGMLAAWDLLPKPSSGTRDQTLMNYCREKLPEALRIAGAEFSWAMMVDVDLLFEHVSWLRQTRLTELHTEKEQLAAKWLELRRELEAPLDRWVQYGIID